jgi:hypothetical protein
LFVSASLNLFLKFDRKKRGSSFRRIVRFFLDERFLIVSGILEFRLVFLSDTLSFLPLNFLKERQRRGLIRKARL